MIRLAYQYLLKMKSNFSILKINFQSMFTLCKHTIHLFFILFCFHSSNLNATDYIDVSHGYIQKVFNFKGCDPLFSTYNNKQQSEASSIELIVHRYQVLTNGRRRLVKRYAITSYSCNNGAFIQSPGFNKPFTVYLNNNENNNLPVKNLINTIELPIGLNDSTQHLLLLSTLSKIKIAENILDGPFESQKSELITLARENTQIAKLLFDEGENSDAFTHLELADKILDFVLNFTPGVSLGRDIYESILGKDLLSGDDLSTFGRSLAIFGVLTCGFGSKVTKALKYFLKGEELSKNILVGEKLFKTIKNLTPQKGNQFVRKLPDLEGTFKDAFEDHIFKGVYEPGEILFQAQRTGQTGIGNWFGPIKPLDAAHADELFNIRKWGNDAGQIKVYIVKERVSGYAGKVAGGGGHQFYIPRETPISEVIEEII